jgi:hypothetical protein
VRVYCACDAGRLLVLALPAFDVVAAVPLAGSPDVILLDPGLRYLYVAIRDPGLIEVFEMGRAQRLGSSRRSLEPTIGIDLDRHRVYAFLPATYRAAVFGARSR